MNFSKICNKKIECRKQFEIITMESARKLNNNGRINSSGLNATINSRNKFSKE